MPGLGDVVFITNSTCTNLNPPFYAGLLVSPTPCLHFRLSTISLKTCKRCSVTLIASSISRSLILSSLSLASTSFPPSIFCLCRSLNLELRLPFSDSADPALSPKASPSSPMRSSNQFQSSLSSLCHISSYAAILLAREYPTYPTLPADG